MTLQALNLGAPPSKTASADTRINWLIDAMVKIDRWSNQNPSNLAQDFSVDNPTVNRALDVAAATLDQLREVVGTLLVDVARGGAKRSA